jgi:hypothetical protein
MTIVLAVSDVNFRDRLLVICHKMSVELTETVTEH